MDPVRLTPPPFPPIISIKAAAAMLGIHPKTYIRRGYPIHTVSPRKRVVIVEELVKAVKGHEDAA